VQLLLLDVDGVLTDGSITYLSGGGETKSFNTQDGLGIKLLQESGVAVGIITARSSEAVERRARDLQFVHVFQGKQDKLIVYEAILKKPVCDRRRPPIWVTTDGFADSQPGRFCRGSGQRRAEIRQRVITPRTRSGGRGLSARSAISFSRRRAIWKDAGKFDR
jgi:3-deoxy-D-manno-octulosonate 8-phosphate phosphatase (KDO 8-P phosphatase)